MCAYDSDEDQDQGEEIAPPPAMGQVPTRANGWRDGTHNDAPAVNQRHIPNPTGINGTPNQANAAKKAAVLAARAEKLTITAAAKSVGVRRETVWAWTKNDPEFAAALESARVEAVEVLEENAYQRAMKGDTLLTIFLIKGQKPETYNDKLVMVRGADDPAAAALTEFSRLMADIRQSRLPQPRQTDAHIIEGTASPAEPENRSQ